MPNEVVEGLSGSEIITDVLLQVKKALQRDCNLRDTDSYGRGYSGKIKISISCFAMDEAKVEMEIPLSPTKEFMDSHPPTPQDATGTDVVVEQEIDIPLQQNLTEIRQAAEQAEQTGQRPPLDEEILGDMRMPAHRRTYGKPTAGGGAEDVT
jgi:hypothetical protein